MAARLAPSTLIVSLTLAGCGDTPSTQDLLVAVDAGQDIRTLSEIQQAEVLDGLVAMMNSMSASGHPNLKQHYEAVAGDNLIRAVGVVGELPPDIRDVAMQRLRTNTSFASADCSSPEISRLTASGMSFELVVRTAAGEAIIESNRCEPPPLLGSLRGRQQI